MADAMKLDCHAIAKDAAERVHKNGGCVPQMAYAPILWALQDAIAASPPAREEAQAEGAGEVLDLYDDKVQDGIAWTLRQVGEALGLTAWREGDGSESVEGDVSAEIHTILVDAGLRDPETNEMAALASPPVSERERELEGALRVIANASRRSETMFGGKMSDVTRVFVNITRVAESALTAQPAGEGK